MSSNDNAIQPWRETPALALPASASTDEIVAYARPHLSTRDMHSIVTAFNAESYEMVATFVWTKAAAVLKRQIATLGMEFVGEMLNRPDLDEDSDPAVEIGDHEAIGLAEDLGLISPTQGLRLKHAFELVGHFTKLEQAEAEIEMMQREEALSLLKTCIISILAQPNFEGALKFADFRRALSERTLKPDDGDVIAISDAPYFFIRTTLSVLLSSVKISKGATQEHVIGNLIVLLPRLWGKMREPEKWQVGQAYAEMNAEGNRVISTALKTALLRVHGFDFVPESLRSNTFTEAASKVLSAHFGFNNFYTESEPMSVLANLGTSIPKPAFAKCMEATLAVWLGNRWGNAWTAESDADRVLDGLRTEQWEYYLNQCLRRDRTVLDKIGFESKPIKRWITLAKKYHFNQFGITDRKIEKLITSAIEGRSEQVEQRAQTLREAARD